MRYASLKLLYSVQLHDIVHNYMVLKHNIMVNVHYFVCDNQQYQQYQQYQFVISLIFRYRAESIYYVSL